MNKSQRIKNILEGIAMLLGAAVMVYDTENGLALVVAILCLSLLVHAVKKLFYYLTMARHMIGGSMILCNALILLTLQCWYFP